MSGNLITIDTVMLDLQFNSKIDALHNICGHLFLLRKSQDPSALYKDIMKREETVSTFAGQQIAIPHVITNYISEPTLCFVRIDNQDFTWNDNDQNVRIIFLLCVPTQANLQKLRQSQSYIFSSIAQLMGDTKTIDLWLTTNEQEKILDSLQAAFKSNLNSTIEE
ncbi:PTS sugar transporter subunit IIA [Psychromonas sp.]|nr:PTS sugar transporter subunit IIA [Psychromonas sp.]